jgi:hypothetical protein
MTGRNWAGILLYSRLVQPYLAILPVQILDDFSISVRMKGDKQMMGREKLKPQYKKCYYNSG